MIIIFGMKSLIIILIIVYAVVQELGDAISRGTNLLHVGRTDEKVRRMVAMAYRIYLGK